MTGRWVIAPALLLSAVVVFAQPPVPLGGELQVNSHTPSAQLFSKVAADAAGGFVVVWNSAGSPDDASSYGVRGQRYAAGGTPLGGELQVNSYTSGSQVYPSVARAPGGDFVVAWQSDGSAGTDGAGTSIQGRRFAADGTPLAGDFQVNSYTPGNQSYPAVAVAPDGRFVVVWAGGYPGDSYGAVVGRRYAADGTPQGGDFRINTLTLAAELFPTVAASPAGGFVVVWDSAGSPGDDTDGLSVQARRLDAAGVPIGSQFQVNTETAGTQGTGRPVFAPGGGFHLFWNSTDLVTDGLVAGRSFDAAGQPQGAEFVVTTFTADSYLNAATALDDGTFLVVWQSLASAGDDDSAWSVQALRLAADGTPASETFQVNVYTTNYQVFSAAAPVPDGFVVTWNSYGSAGTDDDSWSVQARRYLAPLFVDGFESGDTSAWSASVAEAHAGWAPAHRRSGRPPKPDSSGAAP